MKAQAGPFVNPSAFFRHAKAHRSVENDVGTGARRSRARAPALLPKLRRKFLGINFLILQG